MHLLLDPFEALIMGYLYLVFLAYCGVDKPDFFRAIIHAHFVCVLLVAFDALPPGWQALVSRCARTIVRGVCCPV